LTQRQLCAARLIALADTLDKQQQQQHHSKGKGKGKGKQQQADAQPPQQQPQQEYLGNVAAFVTKLQQSGAAQLATVAEGQEAAAEQAQQAASTLQQTLQRMQARLDAGGSSAGEQQRVRALAHLLRLVLLHSLADPAAADPSLAADLDAVYAVAVEGQPAPQRAAQRPAAQQGGSGSDDDMEEGEEGEEEEEEQPPHWHDTLMDVLLSLLARNAAPLPSAPLRDAVDHVFRAFGEDLTPTGGQADLAAHGLCYARLACNLKQLTALHATMPAGRLAPVQHLTVCPHPSRCPGPGPAWAAGMQDMLRVLAKPLDSNAAAGDGEDVFASSEEEEEEEGAASDEDEEEAGSGSEDDEGQPANGAAAAAAGSGSESEGEEEPDIAAVAAAGDSSASDDEGMTGVRLLGACCSVFRPEA
jgi:hypothetical protein